MKHTPSTLLAASFPNASKSCIAANQPRGLSQIQRDENVDLKGAVHIQKLETLKGIFSITISGQCPSGKNAMKVTRTGHHYAGARFRAWRACAMEAIRNQLPKSFQTIKVPVNVRIDYVAGDKRRRDQPGIQDAIWHVLEKSGVVKDDALLWAAESSRSYDKTNPRVTITFL